jgi:uncharacterized RDD family membrane protein YckC
VSNSRSQGSNPSPFLIILIWTFFTVTVSLLPFIIKGWKFYGESNSEFFHLCEKATSNGIDILLVCLALLGSSLGELISKSTNPKLYNSKVILIALTFLLALLSIGTFAVSFDSKIPSKQILNTSVTLFVVTVVLGILSIFITNNGREG